MKIPTDGTKVHESPLDFMWVDKEGILNVLCKNDKSRTVESIKENMKGKGVVEKD